MCVQGTFTHDASRVTDVRGRTPVPADTGLRTNGRPCRGSTHGGKGPDARTTDTCARFPGRQASPGWLRERGHSGQEAGNGEAEDAPPHARNPEPLTGSLCARLTGRPPEPPRGAWFWLFSFFLRESRRNSPKSNRSKSTDLGGREEGVSETQRRKGTAGGGDEESTRDTLRGSHPHSPGRLEGGGEPASLRKAPVPPGQLWLPEVATNYVQGARPQRGSRFRGPEGGGRGGAGTKLCSRNFTHVQEASPRAPSPARSCVRVCGVSEAFGFQNLLD